MHIASLFFALAPADPAYASGNPAPQENICAMIQEVTKKPDLSSVNGFYLILRRTDCAKVQTAETETYYLLDDDVIIRLIEETHHIMFEDFIDKTPKPIRVEFQEALTANVNLDGQTVRRITSVRSVRIDTGAEFQKYSDLNPACPAPNAHQMYVDAPISYKHPEWGTFHLYYEVNSDFDKSKPVVLIPTDAQHDSSQIGMADQYRKIFGLSFNVLTYDYRGYGCSRIPEFQKRNKDWKKAFLAFNSDNAVEDIETIRRHLLGDKKVYLLGGSGISMLGLKYLAKYHQHVSRAFLMSFFKDAEGGSSSGVKYFNSFLYNAGLIDKYAQIIKEKIVPLDQLLFLLQRLLYSDEGKAKDLITRTSINDLSLFNEESKKQGAVDFFIRSAQKYSPPLVVFMYETNIHTSLQGEPDINSPFLQIGEPLLEVERAGKISLTRFDMGRIDQVKTEVLLVAGTLDQVAPIEEMRKIRALMPQSRLAVFKSYHCLMDKGSKQCRNGLSETFFHHGMNSKEFVDYLSSDTCKELFIGLE